MKKFLTFAVLIFVTLMLIKLIHVLFNLGEVAWVATSIPIVMLFYYGSYGLTFPFVKGKDQE
jgi:hypothetical protein